MIWKIIVLVIYSLGLLMIFIYALTQLSLLINYLKAKKRQNTLPDLDISEPNNIPFVTIQLPIYNELYVIDRLLENIVQMNYPTEKLEIQVLDDSTDECREIAAMKISELAAKGHNIYHITREDRTGFKAGALKHGLKSSKGEFIAIFDADFLPQPDWLIKTLPYFMNPEIGVVQTKWGHINRDYSMLTKAQAFALDAHFTIEQIGRNFKGHFINFNGTAGIWRKSCIIDSGNWQSDTLTEDLDLSYRAQLNNWKFKYLPNVETPAELPITIGAARSQQFRWNKGGAETFGKMRKRLWRNSFLAKKTTFHGYMHLLNSSMFIGILIVALLSIPILYIKNQSTDLTWYFTIASFFVVTTLIFFICYWYMYRNLYGKKWTDFFRYTVMFFVFFSIAMGFSFHNTVAVLEGHFKKKSEFIRTPKFNVKTIKDNWKNNKYLQKGIKPRHFVEGLLMLYFGFGLYSAFTVTDGGDYGFLPFHLMLFLGFAYVFIKSVLSKA
ncbi:cellulose synthase family protein [Aegicerativicinus sediminis]|uniref:cellulose synthase family protein n=1 Tax=Aegicerativicinus sediminis TaxID=2893202 RepID=UPI001E60B26B|nr:cellulose synthase family protein [Aegicerativicinus sediminis]